MQNQAGGSATSWCRSARLSLRVTKICEGTKTTRLEKAALLWLNSNVETAPASKTRMGTCGLRHSVVAPRRLLRIARAASCVLLASFFQPVCGILLPLCLFLYPHHDGQSSHKKRGQHTQPGLRQGPTRGGNHRLLLLVIAFQLVR